MNPAGPNGPPMRSKAELTRAIRAGGRAVAVVNTRSRRAAGVPTRLPALLAAQGLGLTARLPVTDPAALPDALRTALATNPDLLIVGGGDGTLATAVDPLGVLPLGTTNNFARSLGLPLDLPAAVATIARGVVADVDLGHVTSSAGQDLFANLASVGVSVQVAHRTPDTLKRVLGRAAYGLTGLRALPAHRPFHATLSTPDGRRRDFWTHQLNIANGRYHAGRILARDASIDDHQLVVYRLGDQHRTRAHPRHDRTTNPRRPPRPGHHPIPGHPHRRDPHQPTPPRRHRRRSPRHHPDHRPHRRRSPPRPRPRRLPRPVTSPGRSPRRSRPEHGRHTRPGGESSPAAATDPRRPGTGPTAHPRGPPSPQRGYAGHSLPHLRKRPGPPTSRGGVEGQQRRGAPTRSPRPRPAQAPRKAGHGRGSGHGARLRSVWSARPRRP